MEESQASRISLHNMCVRTIKNEQNKRLKMIAKQANEISYLNARLRNTEQKEEESLRNLGQMTVKNSQLKNKLLSMEHSKKKEVSQLSNQIEDMTRSLEALKMQLEMKIKELGEMTLDYGETLVERDRMAREMSKPKNQNMVSVSTQTSCEPLTDRLRGNEQQQVEPIDLPGNYHEIQPIEETGENTRVRLARRPDTVVERNMFNNYALYVSILPYMLRGDQERFGIWATQRLINIAPNMPVRDVLLQLDDMGVISVTNQNELRVFFEEIRRFDLVHVVDQYLMGDYAFLREINLRNLIRVSHDDRQPPVNGEYDVGHTPEDLNAF